LQGTVLVICVTNLGETPALPSRFPVGLETLAAQHFHAHRGFDAAKPQFDLPTPGIEFGEVLRWILLRIPAAWSPT